MIDTFFTVLKKSMVAVMFVVVGLAMTYVPQPHHDGGYSNVETAHAAGAAIAALSLIQETYTAVSTAYSEWVDAWIQLKESLLDAIAWNFAKNIMSSMTGDIVDWVNGSTDGKQRFILNLEDTLKEEADIAIGEFINSIDNFDFLCDPWRFNIKLAVAIQYDADRDRRPVPECTLTDIVDNIDDFLNGDFISGGWPAWFEMTSNPRANTPAGNRVTALQLANEAVAEAEDTQRTEANWADGMLATKECRDVPITGGGNKEDCFNTTPGNVIKEQLSKAMGSGQDQLAEADEFDEFAVSLLTELASKAFGGSGLLGLSGGTGFTYSGYTRGSFVEDLTNNPLNDIIDFDGDSGIDDGFDDSTDLGGVGNDPGSQMNAAVNDLKAFQIELAAYEEAFEDFIANPNNATGSLDLVAEIALNQVNNTQIRVDEDLPLAEALLAEYNALINPTAAEESSILQQFYSLALLSEVEFETLTDQWDEILGAARPDPNPDTDPGPIDPCDIDPFDEGCPCFNNPSCNIDRE